MSTKSGDVFVDRRPDELLRTSSSSNSVASARDDRSEPGEWSESLEPFGMINWVLPGQGEKGAGCGEWYPEAVCETCGEPTFSARSCGRRSCPDCWGMWAKESAVRPTVRIQAWRYTQPPDHRRQAAHAIISPTEGEIRTEKQYWDGRTKAAEMAKEKGWRGFTVIPHPFRVTKAGKERYREEDPEYGIWVWLRNDVRDMHRYTYWSPHYHVVGATGKDMEPAKDSDKWVYHFKRSVEPFAGIQGKKSHNDLYGLFRYLLSHTGYPEGSTQQVVTWYGDLANSVFVEDATEDWQHQKPSAGVLSGLQRAVEEVAGLPPEEQAEKAVDESESDDLGSCPCDGCDGVLIDVLDVSQYLRQNRPPPRVRRRMETALDWRLGRVQPPAGLKHPTTKSDAKEAFDALL